MIDWHRIPFVRLTVPFIFGILLAESRAVPPFVLGVLPAVGIGLLFFVAATLMPPSSNRKEYAPSPHWCGLCILALFFLVGILWRQLHLDIQEWVNPVSSYLLKQSERGQAFLLQQFQHYGIRDNSLATLSALTLGDRSLLYRELKNSFIQSGAMHVLAVSGLHVGILYLVLKYALTKLFYSSYLSRGKYYAAVLTISALWSYALLTGMSASVVRAVLMFSLFSVGKLFYRNTSSLNVVAATAFIMLLIHPSFLFHVGFQLSFAAVASIVSFYPYLYPLLVSRFWLLNKIWALTAVSLSAQLGVLPLSLYYFGQFPIYFLISNLIVALLTAGILHLFLLFLISLVHPPLAHLVAQILHQATQLLNHSVTAIAHLPYASITSLRCTIPEVLVCYLALFISYQLFKTPKGKYLIYLLSAGCLLVIINILQYFYVFL